MNTPKYNSIITKLFSTKVIILCVIFLGILFISQAKLIKRFLRYEAAQIRDYIHKDFLEIDTLKLNYINIDTIYITIPKESLSIIHKTRKRVLNNYFKTGEMNIQKHNYHTGFTKYKNYTSKSKIKLFGMNSDHYNKNKKSLRVKFQGGEFFAKKKVNFLSPKTRSFQMDQIYNTVYRNVFNGIEIQQKPILLCINNISKGIYFMEDFFDKYMIEKNRKKESFIFESGFNDKFQGSKPISELETEEAYFNINTLPKGKKWKNLSKRIIDLFHNGNSSELFNLIDTEKLNAVIGLCLLSQDYHPLIDINLHWYYNPTNNKLEPLIRESYIKEIPTEYSINKIWAEFYKKTTVNPELKLINEWIAAQEEQNAKKMILQSALKSALYIQRYLSTHDYKNFIEKLNTEFSYNTSKQEIILKENITQIISKIKLQESNLILNDSIITISDDMKINKDFVIQKNVILKINPGISIKLEKNANIYIYGKINAMGNASNPIRFIGEEGSNSSIYINSLRKSNFNFCQFKALSALNNNLKFPLFKDFWQTSSAITIYESMNVSFNKCLFINNKNGDDMINVVRSDSIKFNHCNFFNILSDALDSDFSNVTINYSKFISIGNDAVDGSNSNIKIHKGYFEKIADKAISAGEESQVNIINSKIKNSELALVVKDGSLLDIENVYLENNSMDLIAFSKKEEYSAPRFKLLKCPISNYLIDKKTSNLGTGDYYRTSQSIQDVLYGTQYGKSSERE